ncbi:MAG: kynurenine formamidase [Planctomycetota bacterium]
MKTLITLAVNIFVLIVVLHTGAHADIASNEVGKSPWGAEDEIGTLNMMSADSSFEILKQIASGKLYDLGVDLFIGMPNCCAQLGATDYQIKMTQRPAQGDKKEPITYSGDTISMSTHIGTHIDTLNHFGLKGKIWNEVSTDDALGIDGWSKSGADKYPPIVARGVLIDVAGAMEKEHLPASYVITVSDLKDALEKQDSTLQPGDVVLIRTGLIAQWPDSSKYRMNDQAGLGLEAAQWLVENQKAMLLGADNFGLESFPSSNKTNFAPLHTYLLGEKGVSFLEVVWLEELAKDKVYEFLFIASPLKLRGATGSPVRPLAIPIQRTQ